MIQSIHKFYDLAPERRRLLIEAGLLVAAARLALRLLPFRAVERLARAAARGQARGRAAEPEAIGWAVGVAAAYVPHASCLARALAARAMLERRGTPAALRIGVAKDDANLLAAHAWVESAGQVVIGGTAEQLARYQALPELVGERA